MSTLILFFWIRRTEKRILNDFAGFIDAMLSDINKDPKKYATILMPAFKLLMSTIKDMALEGVDERVNIINNLPVSVKGWPVRAPIQMYEFFRRKKEGEEGAKSNNAKNPFG